jgi:hypothetical protein
VEILLNTGNINPGSAVGECAATAGLLAGFGVAPVWGEALLTGLGMLLGLELLAGVVLLQAVRQRTSMRGDSWRI